MVNVEVFDVISVSEKNGYQSVWCRVPDNPQYSYSYECESGFDFKKAMQPGKSYIVEAAVFLKLVHMQLKNGSARWVNVPSFKLVKVLEEIS